MSIIGSRVPKRNATEKATGHARYIQDLRLPGMLEGKIKRSPLAHGRIVSIDTSRCRQLRGVHAVITARDVAANRFGYAKDTTALKGEYVRRVGDEIAAVAAVDADTAREALDLITVQLEPLPAVLDPEEALAPGAQLVHADRESNLALTFEYKNGDVEKGCAEAAQVVEGVFRLGAQSHGCVGTAGVIAEWDSQGRLTLHDPTQIPFLLQRDLARALGLSPARLRVVQPTIAGGFGARLDLYPHEVIAPLLARAAGKPVRIVFDREEEFITDPVRPRTVVRIRTAAAADGKLLAREADVLVDCGAYVSWGGVTPVVMMHTFGCFYKVPHVRFKAEGVYTNTAPTGAMRGFGNPEITFAIESQMDELAAKLGRGPIELRLLNSNEPGETTPQGSKITSCGMVECLEAVRARLQQPSPVPVSKLPHLRRGVGVAALFHVGGGARIYRSDGCGATVKVDDFGKVTVIVGATDIGQGMETMAAQIAAEVLGVPLEAVLVASADTDVRPWDVGVHASRTTFIAGNAVKLAAEDARRQLEEAREQLGLPEAAPYDKVIRALHFKEGGRLVAGSAYYDPPTEMLDKESRGNISAAYLFGTQGVELEVDVETGRVRVLRVVAAHDVGRALNPMYVEAAIEGGVLQGLGYALLEEVSLEEGRMVNPSFLDYRMPGPQDTSVIESVIVETNDPTGPFGAKGLGEAPLIPIPAAVANAIADATGVRPREMPVTSERLWRLLQKNSNAGERRA